QAGLQQQPVLQLDPELPSASVRRLGEGRQGRVRLRPRQADERRLRRHRAGSAGRRVDPELQRDASREAGIFHHLITLPTYHTAALSTDQLAKGYFGDEGMLAYVAGVQRREIREGVATVKHQDMAGSNIGDD